MGHDSLDSEFKEAVELINSYTESFPADLLLRLYAYYKKATNNYTSPKGKKPMITAFKTNALVNVFEIDPILYLVFSSGFNFDSTSANPIEFA